MTIKEYAFCNCTGLTSITIPNSVTEIYQGTFSGCSSLETCNLPNSLTYIGLWAFGGCTSLTSIVIPESVAYIDEGAFRECANLSSIKFPQNSNIIIGQNAFISTAWYENQLDGIVYIGKAVYKYKGTMPENTSLKIKDGTKYISPNAFDGCTNLTSIELPDGLTIIGRDSFMGCNHLSSINIPSSIVNIGHAAFYGCEELHSVSITSLSAWLSIYLGTEGVGGSTEYSNPLYYAHHLYLNGEEVKDLIIPDDVTIIPSYAFINCEGIEVIKLHKNVTEILSNSFLGCNNIQSIIVYNKRPPKIVSLSTTFDHDIFNSCTLFVPEGSENAYYVADGWKEFKKIETIGAVEKVPQDVNGDGIVDTQDVLEIYKYIQEH